MTEAVEHQVGVTAEDISFALRSIHNTKVADIVEALHAEVVKLRCAILLYERVSPPSAREWAALRAERDTLYKASILARDTLIALKRRADEQPAESVTDIRIKCPDCNGSGLMHGYDCDCRGCDGSGRVSLVEALESRAEIERMGAGIEADQPIYELLDQAVAALKATGAAS